MELQLILSFIAASVILALMPGPDNIFVLTESLTKGYKNGIVITAGLCLGVLVHTLAAATGLSIIIQKSAMAFSVIKYFGAAYMFYLAFAAFKEKRIEQNFEQKGNIEEFKILPLLKKGFLMNVLNPKVSLFFIAFLPQFVSKNGFNITIQMIILGAIFVLQTFVVFGMIAILSGKLTKYLNDPKFWKFTKWSKVGVLSILGTVLAFSKR